MRNLKMIKNKIDREANSFDEQICERIENGYIPDLRNKGRNEWFENNIWRDPFYSDLLYGNIVRKINKSIKKYIKKNKDKINILEVACGPGHISLELSRYDYNIKAIDISPQCIQIAKETNENDIYREDKSNLQYLCKDFFEFKDSQQYDIILFCCSLHHFRDIVKVLKKVNLLLIDNGIIFIDDPTKISLKNTDIVIISIIRTLLSLGNNYFEKIDIPCTKKDTKNEFEKIRKEFNYKDNDNCNVQSPCDGESNYFDMIGELRKVFIELEESNEFSFFDRIVGGVRLESIEKEHMFAEWMYSMDKILCKNNIITSSQFNFIGRKKNI